MSLVSVIIPVFNTEKFLKRCLDSVLSQTLSDIEIICVNDGSTDSSQEILEKFNESGKGSIINSSKMLTEGLDVKGLNLAIILHNSSSSTERIQKMGRVLRLEENKTAEIFSIIIKETVEFVKSSKVAKSTTTVAVQEKKTKLR